MLFALFLFFVTSAAADKHAFNFAADKDDFSLSLRNGYDLFELAGDKTSLEGNIGCPLMPVRFVHVLLPAETQIASYDAFVIDEIALDDSYDIYPAQPKVAFSEPNPPAFVDPDPVCYSQTSGVCPQAAELVSVNSMRSKNIAVFKLYPADYVPADETFIIRREIALSIETEPATAGLDGVSYFGGIPDELQSLLFEDVINPEQADEGVFMRTENLPPDFNAVEYLIITDEQFIDEFQPLIDWKTRKGVPAETVTVQSIYSKYTGAHDQEKIKECIKEYAQTKSTIWVVLGGDIHIIPDYDCYSLVTDADPDVSDNTIPTDLYYAGLEDMNWDDDGDGRAAELEEDTIDMTPDVFVGRLPVRTEADVTAIVNKIIAYEKNPPQMDYSEMMLLSGVKLWGDGDAEGKSEYMYNDWIDPYWEPARWRFYDTATDFNGGPSYDVINGNLKNQLELGYNFLHMATHGAVTSWTMESGTFDSTDALSVINPVRAANIMTIACHSNGFDKAERCLSEAFLVNPNGGATSFCGSSRFGWGLPGGTSTHGPSFKYNRVFYEKLFSSTSDYADRLGWLYANMKQYWAGSCNENTAMRWCQFSINLLGDPEMRLYTENPRSIEAVYRNPIFAAEQDYTIETGEPNMTVCLWQDDIVYSSGQTDSEGIYTTYISPQEGNIKLTVTGKNKLAYTEDLAVVNQCAGQIFLDKNRCRLEDTVKITVSDADLAGHDLVQVYVHTTNLDMLYALLEPVEPGSGVFEKTVTIQPGSPVLYNDIIDVTDGETITFRYQDEDNGSGGTPIIEKTVTVDGQPAVLTNLEFVNVSSTSANAVFQTNEPTMCTIRLALDCAGQDWVFTRQEHEYTEFHNILIKNLLDDTTYYYVIEIVDEVGNVSFEPAQGCGSFRTLVQPDYFTELFSDKDNDLDFKRILFTPDESDDYYSACVTDVNDWSAPPFDANDLGITDDEYFEIVFENGKTFEYYGVIYDRVFVSSNGFLTFDKGDNDYTESLTDHFAEPRISLLFDDLNPAYGTGVKYKQIDDRIIISYVDVPEYHSTGSNSFQAELYFDGRIAITWLDMTVLDGLAGLSAGHGMMDDYYESDFSGYSACDFGGSYAQARYNFAAYADFKQYWLADDCSADDWCGGWDSDKNGSVGIEDLIAFGEKWMLFR